MNFGPHGTQRTEAFRNRRQVFRGEMRITAHHFRTRPAAHFLQGKQRLAIGLYKAEVIHRRGPWRHIDAVEYATLEWVDWFNHRRLLEPIGNVLPAESEMAYCRQQVESAMAA